MTRHLILGGNGFVGRHVARELAGRGQRVVVAGRRPSPSAISPYVDEFRRLDLASADWDTVISDCEIIHHYAWTSIPQTAANDPVEDLEQHVRASLRLLEAARRVGGKRIVFTSSGGTVYGDSGAQPAREDDAVKPVTAYGAAKLAVETYMRVYHVNDWVDCRVARLSNPYGVGQDIGRSQGAVSTFLRKARNGDALTIWGDGEVVRDYVHVAAAAAALTALALHPLDRTRELPVYNVGSGVGTSLNDVVSIVERVLGRTVAVDYQHSRAVDVPVNVLDISRIQAALGWSPGVSIECGIRAMLSDLDAGRTLYATSPDLIVRPAGDGRASSCAEESC